MTSTNQLLVIAMRLTFEAMSFKPAAPPVSTGYAKALQEQKDKSNG